MKSVNLDLWPAGKVDTFKAMSNDLVNSYWEYNLPQNYQKPGPNASAEEVRRFMTEKYVNKKWVDTKMHHDPLYLFENKPEKFAKFVAKRTGQDLAPEPPKAEPILQKASISAPVQPMPKPVQMDDMISFNAPSTSDTFTDFQSAAPMDDGFTSFQGTNQSDKQSQDFQNLLNMVSQPQQQQQPMQPQAKTTFQPQAYQFMQG